MKIEARRLRPMMTPTEWSLFDMKPKRIEWRPQNPGRKRTSRAMARTTSKTPILPAVKPSRAKVLTEESTPIYDSVVAEIWKNTNTAPTGAVCKPELPLVTTG